MKKYFFTIILVYSFNSLFAQNLYEIDLNKLNKDVLTVKLSLEKSPQKDQINFSFPSTVPGTYATQDFGRFVLSMKALSSDGKKLKVKKNGNNTFIISEAKKLKYIESGIDVEIGKGNDKPSSNILRETFRKLSGK